MSVPRIMLVPTHSTGLANAIAAAVAEIVTAQGQRVRYHHVGPLSAMSSWDRWEGAAFLDPALYDPQSLVALYDVATRGAQLSLLSASTGILDRREGAGWTPLDVAAFLDCPMVVVMDCRGWGAGLRALVAGLKTELKDVNLAGALLCGLADVHHCDLLRGVLREQGVSVVGCLMQGDGPAWETMAPGPWGLPLEASLLESVSRQVDLAELQTLAGQRGFLSPPSRLTDRGGGGPLVMVAGGRGFTPWSRDSIEVLRSAGARVQRLDLAADEALPEDASGLILAGTVWPADLTAMAANRSLLHDVRRRIATGLPTVALGGGMLYLLEQVQDSLGRTTDLVGALPGRGEILWDLETMAYVHITAQRDSLLLGAGGALRGWVGTECELPLASRDAAAPFLVKVDGADQAVPEGAMDDTLLCSRAFVHFAGLPDRCEGFVRRCASYGMAHNGRVSG